MFISYTKETPPDRVKAQIAICDDSDCMDTPTILAFEGGSMPITTDAPPDAFLVWYRTGPVFFPPEFGAMEPEELWAAASDFSDIVVARCTPGGCAEFFPIAIGEDWLIPWRSLRLVAVPDTGVATAFNHLSRDVAVWPPQLHVTICTDLTCHEGSTCSLGIEDVRGDLFDIVSPTDGSPRVVFVDEEGGIHLHRRPGSACGEE